jgi:transposase
MSHFFLGIDASKGYADFALLDERQVPVAKGFQLDDTAAGHQRLSSYLQEFVVAHPHSTITAAVESTGGYENNWYRRLVILSHLMPVRVARVNPAFVKFLGRANAKRNRTDQISARDVAEYVATHADKVVYNESTNQAQLRRMWNHIQLMIKQKVQLLNALESAVYGAMPELLTYCRHGVPHWLLTTLSHYPTYEHLRRAPLTEIPFVSQRKAQTLLARIEHGIGDSTVVSGAIIASLATQILALDQQITSAKEQLETACRNDLQVKLLQSFKSIGAYSAVGLLIYIGDVARFASAKKIASYFGLHPVFRQSGDGIVGKHMSKHGAAEVRALLYMVALSAIRQNATIKELYMRFRAQGMAGNAALGVCMHKILRIVYGMLAHNIAFAPAKHRTDNMRTQAPAQHSPQVQRRDYDPHAPISQRQHKKRKEQTASHDENLVTNGISRPHLPSLLGSLTL